MVNQLPFNVKYFSSHLILQNTYLRRASCACRIHIAQSQLFHKSIKRVSFLNQEGTMESLMMDYPLTLQHAYNRAVRLFSRKEIVTRTEDGLHRYTYREWGKRTAQLAHALHKAGVTPGERIATFGWNTYRHLELYFAVPCIGAVLHTLNIRLFAEQLVFIINNAEAKIIFWVGDLFPWWKNIADRLPQ